MRREVRLGAAFGDEAFARAFGTFRQTYNVAPQRASCAPDVLARYCELYEPSRDVAHLHSTRLRFEGVPLVAAVLAPSTLALEGEVDEEKMGDW